MTWDKIKFFWAHSIDTLVSSPYAASGQDADNVLSTFERDIWRANEFTDYHLTFDSGSGQETGVDYFVFGGHNLHAAQAYIGLMVSSSEPFSAGIGWSDIATLDQAVYTMVTVQNSDKIYIFGGQFPYDHRLREYDIYVDTWTVVSSAPIGRTLAAGVVYDNKLYVFGGVDSTYHNDLWRYDFAVDTWQEIGSGASARGHHSAVLYSDKIYLFGGRDVSSLYQDLWEYDITVDTWTDVNCHGTALRQHAAVIVGDEMFVHGGFPDTTINSPVADLVKYNITSDTWTTVSSSEKPLGGHGAAVSSNENIYTFGGNDGTAPQNALYAYSISGNIWTRVTFGGTNPTSRAEHGISFVNSEYSVYVIGGANGGGRADCWRYRTSEFDPWRDFTYVVSPFLPSSGTPYLFEVDSVAYRQWAIEVSSLSGDAYPYIAVALFGHKTELGYADVKTDPNAQEDNANVVLSETGYLLGVHDRYVERRMRMRLGDYDATVYDKVDEWWRAVGLQNFFVAWETSAHSQDVWLMRSEAKYDNPYKVGGVYRDINLKLRGRRG